LTVKLLIKKVIRKIYNFIPDYLLLNPKICTTMSLSVHVLTRIYGEVLTNPPFEIASGASTLPNTKPYPVAPNTYIPTNGLTIWPLANGVQMGPNNFYVYSILELPPTGLNVHSTKYATDTLAATLASSAT
jgi:hypothetical protein